MKKILSFALALILLCGAAFGETAIGTLFDAAKKLAYDTHNVTLSAEAEFYYDGELFKQMHAVYQQDGYRSYLSYLLDTPRLDGELIKSGYTVLGLGSRAYAADVRHGYYYTEPTKTSDTILLTNNRIETQLRLARLMALSVEEYVEETKDGNTYTFKAGSLPELIGNAAYYTLLDYVQDNYYMDLFDIYGYYTEKSNAVVYCDDFTALVETQYKAIYRTEMPSFDEIYDDDTLYGRYSVALSAANQVEAELAAQYDGGVVYLKTDGTHKWYETEEDYLLDNDIVTVYFTDWSKAFKDYYEVECGEKISDEELDYILYSPNTELWDAYNAFYDRMISYYTDLAKKQDPKALTVLIREDGTLKTFDYVVSDDVTVTRRILTTMSFAELKEIDAAVTVDDEGRLTGLKGSAEIEITDKRGAKHELKVDFDCKAENYGTTTVPSTFVPEEYGLVSYEEYVEKISALDQAGYEADENEYDEYWDNILKNDPGKVSFLGVEYETMMNEYISD